MAVGRAEIEAGRAFVRLFLKDDLKSALTRSLKNVGHQLTVAGAAITAAGTAILTPLVASAKVFASMGDNLDKMSGRIGVSVEFLSALGHAAKIGGSDLSQMEVGIRRLQRAAYDASMGSKMTADAFASIGISVKDSNGLLKTTEVLFGEVTKALAGMENNTQKAALATVFFGRSGTALLPMLREGEKGLAAVMEEAKRLGLVLSTEDATAAAKLTDAMTRMHATLKMVVFRIGGALAPTLTELSDKVAESASEWAQWIKDNREVIITAAKVAVGLIAVGTTVVSLGMTLKVLATSITAVSTAFTFLLAHPVVAAIAAITVVVAALGIALYKATSYTAQLSSEMGRLAEKGSQQRQADLAQMDRLKELAGKQELTNEEMTEAEGIITSLDNAYGGFGATVNALTGQIDNLAESLEGWTQAIRATAIAQLEAQIAEIRSNMAEIDRQAHSAWRGMVMGGAAALGAKDLIPGEYTDTELGQLKAYNAELDTLEAKLRGLREGTGREGLETAGAGPSLVGAIGEDSAEFTQRMIERLQALRIAAIEDEYERAKAAIMARYAMELDKARGNAAAMILLQRTVQQEIANLDAETAKRRAEEAQRDADTRIQAEANVREQIARLEIELGPGSEAEKQRRLLNVERARALAEAAQQGLGPEQQELINRLYDLKSKQAGRTTTTPQTTLTATYSAAAARIAGYQGGGPEQKMAAGIGNIDLNTKQLVGLYQQFLAGWRVP